MGSASAIITNGGAPLPPVTAWDGADKMAAPSREPLNGQTAASDQIVFGDESYSMEDFSARLISDIGYIRAHIQTVEVEQKRISERLETLESDVAAVRRRNAAMDAGGCPFVQQLKTEIAATERDLIANKARDETAEKFWGWIRPVLISGITALIVAVITLALANPQLFLKK